MALPAVIAGIGGALAWLNSLPPTAKYIIFIAGLMADASLIPLIGFPEGIIGSVITAIFNYGFKIPVIITSWELVIIFMILPLFFYALKH